MAKIINMEEYVREKYFVEQVLPFFDFLNTDVYHVKEKDTSLFTLPYKEGFLYVFLEYTPRNMYIEKTTVMDRFFHIKRKPRTSKGEWVVNKLYEIGPDYHSYLQSFHKNHEYKDSLISQLHYEIQN